MFTVDVNNNTIQQRTRPMLPMKRLAKRGSQKDSSSHWRIRRTPDPGQEMKAKMDWPCFNISRFSKDNPPGHSERKKKNRQTEEEMGRQYQKVDRNGLCKLN